jgi:hypothetical protein
MAKTKKNRKGGGRGPSGGSRGMMTGIRNSTKSIAGTKGGKKKKRPLNFWDVFFWMLAISAVIFFVYRRFG